MGVKLKSSNYGKSKVRVVKVSRTGDTHTMKEFSVNIQLKGDFEDVHTTGDNSKVLPTDTMKNTVYTLAKDHPVNSIEDFALHLSEHFIKNNSQVTKVRIEISESLWGRISIDGNDHPHSFVSSGNEKRITKVTGTRENVSVESGISDLLVMKTTKSAFFGYIKDKYTTLPETHDRIFETEITAKWKFNNASGNDFNKAYENIRRTVLTSFAEHDSLSVQQTLYYIGENILGDTKEVNGVFLSMPNKHCLLIDLNRFGLQNNNEIFVPTDEPHGLIEATIIRN